MRFAPDPPTEPDDDAVPVSRGREDTIVELLRLCEEFLRGASPCVHAELRRFVTERGYHPITGEAAFIDACGFASLDPVAVSTHVGLATTTERSGG